MTDRETDVDGLLRQSVERAELDAGEPAARSMSAAVARGRRLRRRRIGLGALATLVVAAGVALPVGALLPLGNSKTNISVGPASPAETTSPTAGPSHANWVTYHLPAEGLTINAPSGWNLIEDPLPALARPHALIEMASYFAPLDPNSGCVAPTDAIEKLPDDQVVFWLIEAGGEQALPPRPDPFQLHGPSGFDCITRSAYLTPFSDQGRNFELFAVFGSHASDALRQEVIDSLNSLKVDPAGGAGPGSGAAKSWFEPPTFTPAPGWQTLSSSTHGSSLSTPDGVPMTWASNTSFQQADLGKLNGGSLTGEFWPEQTIAALTGDGVVLVVSFDRRGYTTPIDGDYPTNSLPLDIHDANGPVEGGKQSVLWTAVNGQYLTVRFFYGTDLPTDAQYAAAQTELNNLVVPALPPSK
jgi:hypothetical protein